MPVVTFAGIIDADGNHYHSAADSPYASLLKGYEKVAYNQVFDETNRKNHLFSVN